jgi:8-amino-7-oxononanoate synthase
VGDAWTAWAEAELAEVRAAGRWRSVRTLDARGPVGTLEGRRVVAFASNDYLGLSAHPAVIAAAHAALDRWGAGSTAARLVVGARPVHAELESELADWKGCERAALFPTGYAANLGLLSALAGRGTTVLSDELNHASIIDGSRLAHGDVVVFRHRDLDHLDRLLAAAPGRRLVVTDSVFSMDGDAVDLPALAACCARHGALLVLDEAHAVLGPSLPLDAGDAPVVRMGTLSKALGSVGGFVAGPAALVDLLVNRARPYIFTTAGTPADAAAALAALRVVRGEEGERLRARLRHHVDRLRPGHPSPIVPVVLGEEAAAVGAAAALLERGVLVPAIRPPTVAPGTSRLRVALSAAHTDEQVDLLLASLAEVAPGALDTGP